MVGLDLQDVGIRHELHLDKRDGNVHHPSTIVNMTLDEMQNLCEIKYVP